MDDTPVGDRGSTATPWLKRTLPALPSLLFVIVCSLCLNETMLYSPDSVNYMGWAHSFSRLGGFKNTMGPEPERYVTNAPLYPVLLAPASLAFPLSIPAAKITTLLTGLLTLAGFQIFLSGKIPPGTALGAALLLALNPLFILYSTQVLSDIPFAACCIVSMILLERVISSPGGGANGSLLLVGVLTCGLFLREVGLALVLAAAFLLFRRHRTKTLLLLFITVVLAYGLWFIRNELLVARAENPLLKNMSFIFSHVYTESGASPVAEVTARLARSVRFYGPALLSLVTPQFGVAWMYSVTDATDGIFAALQGIAGAAHWPLALIVFTPVVLGVRRVAASVMGPFLAVLIPLYGAIIAVYPVSDVRFLFPALLLFLWCGAAGVVSVEERIRKPGGGRTRWVLLLLVTLVALPNLVWIRNVVETNVWFRNDPAGYVDVHTKNDPFPEELLLIPRRAASWIVAESPPGTAVGSKIKAAALWLQGRPLLVLNPLLPLEEFDNRIRDYRLEFLICELQAHQIPDYAFQMALSTKFMFTPAFAFGDVRVYRIERKSDPRQPSLVPPAEGYGPAESRFLQGVYALAHGKLDQAVTTFESMERVPGAQTYALFYAAVAREFTMDLDSAEVLFSEFRTVPQSASYLRQAQTHEDVIALLRSAAVDPDRAEKAAKYREAAMRYWILGYRTQAVMVLRESLRLDPGEYTAEVFGAVFSLASGDTAGARLGVRLAERARPTDPLTRSLRTIISSLDSLQAPGKKETREIAIGREYAALGLYEMGVDQALKGLRDGENRGGLRLLADMYIKKERRGPALSALRRLEQVSPGDSSVAAEILKYSRLWE